MKFLFVNTLYNPYETGGSGRSVECLAEWFAQLGHEVTVLTTAVESELATTRNGVAVFYRKHSNVYTWTQREQVGAIRRLIWHMTDDIGLMQRKMLRKFIKDVAPDIILTNTIGGFSSAVFSIAAEEAIPLVHTLRDYYLLCVKSSLMQAGQNCGKRCASCRVLTLARQTRLKSLAGVISISQFLLDKHREHGVQFTGIPTRVIRNAVSWASQDKPPPADHIPQVIGYLGRISREKGVSELCESFVDQHSILGLTKLLVAGEGNSPYAANLKRSLTGSSHIHFLGSIDAQTFFGMIDALVVPSLWNEPLGRVVLEAHSSGIPVLASKMGALPELIEPGVNGWLYDGAHPDLRLISQVHSTVVHTGQYSVDSIGRKVFEFIKDVM